MRRLVGQRRDRGVPYAALQNKDSHLLRQSMADLGPAPNIITEGRCAYGVEAEVFLNYAVTPNIEVGAGVRYWGLASRDGSVAFGPDFAPDPAEQFRPAALRRPAAGQGPF